MYLISQWRSNVIRNDYGKCSKILKTFLFRFATKTLVIRDGIHNMLVSIANREDPDQTASEFRSSLIWVCTVCQSLFGLLQEMFHVYLSKFEIPVSHLFLIIFSNNKFTLINQSSRNAQSPRKYLLTLFAGLKHSLKMSSQNLSV